MDRFLEKIDELALADPTWAEVPLLREAYREVGASLALLQAAFSAWDLAESTLLVLGEVRGGLEHDAALLEGRLRLLGTPEKGERATDRFTAPAIRQMGSFLSPVVPLLAALWRAEADRGARLARWEGPLEAGSVELPRAIPALLILRQLTGDARHHARILKQDILALLQPGEEPLLRGVLGELASASAPRLRASLRLFLASILQRLSAPRLPAPVTAVR